MNIRRFGNELCWFGASVLAMAAYGFVLAWIDAGTASPVSPAHDAWLLLSAAALGVMILLISLALSTEKGTCC